MARAPTTEGLEATRYYLMVKGFVNKSELRRFIPCGQKRAQEIWDDVNAQIKNEGLESLSGTILVSRLLKYIGKTEKKIVEDYERTKKG